MLRWAIIGAGIIADVRMAPAIRQATGCELAAVQARDAAKEGLSIIPDDG
jgi:predicted dehydrogenase